MAIRDFGRPRSTSRDVDSPEMLDLKVSRERPLTIPSPTAHRKNETQIKITVDIPTGSVSDTSARTD